MKVNEQVRSLARQLLRDIQNVTENIKTSPGQAAERLGELLQRTGIYKDLPDPAAVEREIREIKKEISITRTAIEESPHKKLLEVARSLGYLRIHHETLISGIRANLEVVEDGLHELAERCTESISDLKRRAEELETMWARKTSTLAYLYRLQAVSSWNQRLATTDPSRVKPVLRKLGASLASLAEIMKERGDARIDGVEGMRKAVKRILETIKADKECAANSPRTND